MKKCIAILLFISLFSGVALAEDVIMLEPDACVEKSINLETPNQELMERGVQKLNNNGLILKNSISPVNGLIYDSTSIPTERQIKKETAPANEE